MLEVQVGTVADSESCTLLKPLAVVAATPCRPEQPTEALHLTWAPRCTAPGKQGTRLIKLTAACCGCTVRTTRKWVDLRNPLCPHGQPMAEE
jgi:hypothetical protein